MNEQQTIEAAPRVHSIDALRGFSLFGILLANLLIFQYGIFGKDHMDVFHLSTLDRGAYDVVKIVIEGSFMPIFTFLFGFSVIKMAESLKCRHARPKWHIFRRGLLLIGAGSLHGYFIWEGDILSAYGIMSIFLLVFINRKPRTVLIAGCLLLIVYGALNYGAAEDMMQPKEGYVAEAIHVYQQGTYDEVRTFRTEGEAFDEATNEKLVFAMLFLPVFLAPMFLFGMYAAKKDYFADGLRERSFYQKALVLIPIGWLMKAAGYYEWTNEWNSLLSEIGALVLAFGYIFAFVYVYTTRSEAIEMKAFEAVGKLSMTNYIMQSVIATFIFYSYGLGLFAKAGIIGGIGIGLLIYTAQCVISYWYLQHFKRGPLEVLMRIGTNLTWNGRVRSRQPKVIREEQ